MEKIKKPRGIDTSNSNNSNKSLTIVYVVLYNYIWNDNLIEFGSIACVSFRSHICVYYLHIVSCRCLFIYCFTVDFCMYISTFFSHLLTRSLIHLFYYRLFVY